jgi:hypothetical protein
MPKLASYAYRILTLDFSEDDQNSQPIDIVGYRVVGIVYPDAWEGVTPDVNFQVDPGDGTFRNFSEANGTALLHVDISGTYLNLLAALPNMDTVRVIGARLRLFTDAAQTADRQCLILLEAL